MDEFGRMQPMSAGCSGNASMCKSYSMHAVTHSNASNYAYPVVEGVALSRLEPVTPWNNRRPYRSVAYGTWRVGQAREHIHASIASSSSQHSFMHSNTLGHRTSREDSGYDKSVDECMGFIDDHQLHQSTMYNTLPNTSRDRDNKQTVNRPASGSDQDSNGRFASYFHQAMTWKYPGSTSGDSAVDMASVPSSITTGSQASPSLFGVDSTSPTTSTIHDHLFTGPTLAEIAAENAQRQRKHSGSSSTGSGTVEISEATKNTVQNVLQNFRELSSFNFNPVSTAPTTTSSSEPKCSTPELPVITAATATSAPPTTTTTTSTTTSPDENNTATTATPTTAVSTASSTTTTPAIRTADQTDNQTSSTQSHANSTEPVQKGHSRNSRSPEPNSTSKKPVRQHSVRFKVEGDNLLVDAGEEDIEMKGGRQTPSPRQLGHHRSYSTGNATLFSVRLPGLSLHKDGKETNISSNHIDHHPKGSRLAADALQATRAFFKKKLSRSKELNSSCDSTPRVGMSVPATPNLVDKRHARSYTPDAKRYVINNSSNDSNNNNKQYTTNNNNISQAFIKPTINGHIHQPALYDNLDTCRLAESEQITPMTPELPRVFAEALNEQADTSSNTSRDQSSNHTSHQHTFTSWDDAMKQLSIELREIRQNDVRILRDLQRLESALCKVKQYEMQSDEDREESPYDHNLPSVLERAYQEHDSSEYGIAL